MGKYIPFQMHYDDVPIDLSFVFKSEKPAGKHGFLKVNGNAFTFEDGTQARFWGTNFNSGMNFPDSDYSEKVSRRLAKTGVNLVRFHQLDAEWSTPNIFAFTKGPRLESTMDFDPESMKRLDYLVYCLKKEGIYCYLDMLTYRKFKSGDGVENAVLLSDSAKPYSIFNRRLIDLQKKFMYDIWNHVNPYTGLAYKDDPVFVMTEITNECDLFNKTEANVEPYISEFRKLLFEWVSEKNIDYEAANADFMSRDSVIIDFKIELQEKYYVEMMSYMRSIGVRIPVTGTNWAINAANRKTQLVTDFCDGHTYWYDWQWGADLKKFENRPMSEMADSCFSNLVFSRSLEKPFFVSEWDVPWPNDYRAESPVLFAAVSALQGWAGCAIHTYAYDSNSRNNPLGKEMSSSSIGGTPYREGVFTTWNDPAKFGLFYHSSLIVRRGDVKTAEKSFTIRAGDMDENNNDIPALRALAEVSKVGMVYGQDSSTAGCFAGDDAIIKAVSEEVSSDTGELYRSWGRKYGTIDTPMTKCVYGFLKKQGAICIDGLKVTADTEFAVIAMSSLSDKILQKSDNILLTAAGRSQNTGAEFNDEHTQLLNFGTQPVLVEVIEAEISLRTCRQDLKVWAVNAEGFYIGALKTKYSDGLLSFKIGAEYPSMYYLIQAD